MNLIVKVNCIFLDKYGFNCLHKDSPKSFFFFKPTCMDVFKKCELKKEITRSPLYPPPAPQSNVIKERRDNELY